jgi:hypothetical protein
MSPIGHMFKLLFVDLGPGGPPLLLLLTVFSMWLGWRYSRPSKTVTRVTPKTVDRDKALR